MNSYSLIMTVILFLMPGRTHKNFDDNRFSLSASASNEARPHFEKGLLLLHNFEYVDAAEEFLLAQQEDPDFVMAYWGEAMCYDHPIWREVDIEKSRAVLKKIGESSDSRIAKTKTPLEKDLMQSIEILFGDGSQPDRQKAYSMHMESLYRKHSGNDDVAAFYALSLLAIKKGWSEWEEQNQRAEEITAAILKTNPDHPGALHYRVHANDHPRYARQGLEAADRYAKAASYAGHALHMPSHIYLALGQWEDVVRSNEVSWQASVDRKTRKKLSNDELSYHSHLWLAYGYLQQGRYEEARRLIENQIAFTADLPSGEARYHLNAMKGHYLVNTNDWNGSVAQIEIKLEDLDATTRWQGRWIEGYRLFQRKDLTELKALVDAFDSDVQRGAKLQKENEEVPICGLSSFTKGIPTKGDIRAGRMFVNELMGMHAWLAKDTQAAEEFLKAALPSEGSVVVGPPYFFLSPHELYGNFLMEAGRFAEALNQFEKALAASPMRHVTLRGKLSAAVALKDSKTAASTRSQLKQILRHADAAARKGVVN